MAFLQVGANPRTRFVMNSTWKRQLDAPEWAVLRCAGKGERCGSIGTCVPMDSTNGLRLRLSRALQGGQRCGLLLDRAEPQEQHSQRAAARVNRALSALTHEVRG